MRGRRIAGGGVIDSAISEDAGRDDTLPVTIASRATLLGHRGAVIWLTGFPARQVHPLHRA